MVICAWCNTGWGFILNVAFRHIYTHSRAFIVLNSFQLHVLQVKTLCLLSMDSNNWFQSAIQVQGLTLMNSWIFSSARFSLNSSTVSHSMFWTSKSSSRAMPVCPVSVLGPPMSSEGRWTGADGVAFWPNNRPTTHQQWLAWPGDPMSPGPRLNIKTVFPKYRDSYVKDKTVARPSYL